MEKNPWFRALLVLLVLIAGLYLAQVLWGLLSTIGDILLLFFLSWLAAFALTPLARWTQVQTHAPWPLAIALVYLGLTLGLLLGGAFLVPTTTEQAVALGRDLPRYAQQIPAFASNVQAMLLERGIDVSQIPTDNLVRDIVSRAQTVGSELAGSALVFAQGVAQMFFNVVIILILSFYMVLDGEQIIGRLLDLLPQGLRKQMDILLDRVGRTFGGYLRGVLIQGVIYGLMTAAVMWVFGLPFVAVVGIFAGLMLIIPIIGGIIAIIPPILLAAISGDWGKVAIVAVTLFVLQNILLNVVMPKIMSQSVGLHPLLVFASLLIGQRLAGIWGAVFGVPVGAVLYSTAVYFYEQNRRSWSAAVAPAAAAPAPQRTWVGRIIGGRRFSRRRKLNAAAPPNGLKTEAPVETPVAGEAGRR